MKKYIFRFILFMLILFIILLILSRITLPKTTSGESELNNLQAMKILGEEKDTVDVIMYGDSEAMASTIPTELWKNYGFSSFICGTSGQTLPDTLRIAYDTLKKQKPKIVILEADNIFEPTEFDVPIARVLYEILPIIEYHNRWKTLTFQDFFGKFDYSEKDPFKGYYYLIQSDPGDASQYMAYSDETEIIPKINKLYVKILKKYCEIKGSQFAIVSVPSCKNWNYKKHNAITQFAEEENIEFIDMNLENVNIDWQTETPDKGDHLNYFGAVKCTEFIANWLKEKDILENHSGDEKYNSWNEEWIK